MKAKNILVADDDQAVRDVLNKLLQKEGYRVFLAANGEKAVEVAQKNPIHAAILDIEMPIIDGIEALKKIKERDQSTEVLILTGHANLDNLKQTIVDNGAFDYILKPFRKADIIHTIQNALLKRDYVLQNNFIEREWTDRIAQLEKDFEERTHQLRESQIKYREIIENSNDIILVAQDGKLKFVNSKALELTGYTQQETVNIPLSKLVFPEDCKMVPELHERNLEEKGPSRTYCFRMLRKNEEPFWVEANSKRTVWKGKPAILAFMRDITDRKRAELQLIESEERYRTAIEHSNDGVIILKGGSHLYVNQKYLEIFGYDQPEEFLGRPKPSIIHPDDRERVIELSRRRQRGENVPSRYEFKGLRKDGQTIHIEVSATQTTYRGDSITLAYLRDITERKEVEEKLRKAHADMENLLSSISSIFIGLSPENRIIQWNSAAKNAFGLEDATVVGQPLSQCGIQWDWPRLSDGISRCQTKCRPIRLDNVHFKRTDGKDGFLGITINPIRGNGKAISGLTIMGADITERKILESQLTQAQKLESIGQLASGIAHEINTPTQYVGDNTRFLQDSFNDVIHLIQKYAELLEAIKVGSVNDDLLREVEKEMEEADVDYLTQEIPTAIQQTLEGVERISKIVLAMKEFSHPGTVEKTAIDINKAIENTITVARNEWKYVAEMVTDLDPSLSLVPCLPGEFNQVILNMIINAAHAIADVVGDGSEQKGSITISTRQNRDWAEIRIIDTGIGIPEEIRSRIFDPFFTTKEVGKGTGQGLAIAHSVIVKKHGGRMTFETEEGKGTTFIIGLPLETEETSTGGRK